jgi:hypothetical protein
MVFLMLLYAPAVAQVTEVAKDIKFGQGCIGPITTLAPKFGTCTIAESVFRVWCPSGRVYDRRGLPPQSSIARSICNLSQVP